MSSIYKSMLQSLQHDTRTILHWNPVENKLHCALRDAAYLVIDLPKFISYTNSNYAAFRRFIRQSRINKGKINPEDFKGVDTNALRDSLTRHAQFRGPLQKIDFRVFYWLYFIMMGFVLFQGLHVQHKIDTRVDKTGMTLDERRHMFDDDYLEDIRPR